MVLDLATPEGCKAELTPLVQFVVGCVALNFRLWGQNIPCILFGSSSKPIVGRGVPHFTPSPRWELCNAPPNYLAGFRGGKTRIREERDGMEKQRRGVNGKQWDESEQGQGNGLGVRRSEGRGNGGRAFPQFVFHNLSTVYKRLSRQVHILDMARCCGFVVGLQNLSYNRFSIS